MYTGVGIVFIYIFNLTFFGGCLAVAGDLEKRDLHGLVCMPKQKVTCIPVRSTKFPHTVLVIDYSGIPN
jgi:hypothetical protein